MPHTSSDSSSTGTSLIAKTGFTYFPLALIARLPFAMMVIGVLTIVVSARGSMQLGGLGSAMVGIGSAAIGPLIGAAADRYGQRIVLLVTAVLHSAALVSLVWVAYSSLPNFAVFAVAFAVGATSPQTSPMSRARLVAIIRRFLPVERQGKVTSTTLAYESAADEIVFVFGPVIVGLLATTFNAGAPIIAAAALTLLFVIAFALHPSAKLSPTTSAEEEAAAPVRELFRARLLVIVFGIASVGLVFGTTLTSLTAYMQEHGDPEAAGLVYGAMGVGSAILALAVSLFSPRFTLRARWVVFSVFVTVGGVILATSHDAGMPRIILALAIMGIGVGPLLVTLYTLGTARSPQGRSATVMTMLGSGIILGQSLAAAFTGTLSEHELQATGEVRLSLMLPLIAGAIGLLLGAANWFLTPKSMPRTATSPNE